MFDLAQFVQNLLAALDIPALEAKVVAWLQEAETKYPDLGARVEALAAWITSELEAVIPKLVLTSLKDTIFGIASDIVHGTADVDPKAWTGGA